MKPKIGNILFTRKSFIEIIEVIKSQCEHDSKCSEAMNVIYPNDFNSGYDNHRLINQLVSILKEAFNDNHKDSWIEYYLWELEFGKKYKKGMATEKDGTNINLSDAGKLWDFLTTK